MLFVLHTMWQFILLWTVFFLHFLLFTLLVSFCLLYSDGKIDRIFKPAISMLLADITMHSKHWNLQIASFLWNTPTISDLNYVIAELLYHKPRLSNKWSVTHGNHHLCCLSQHSSIFRKRLQMQMVAFSKDNQYDCCFKR